MHNFKITHTSLTRGGLRQNPGLTDTGKAVVLQVDCKLLVHSWILEYDIMLTINFPEFLTCLIHSSKHRKNKLSKQKEHIVCIYVFSKQVNIVSSYITRKQSCLFRKLGT